jgi:hypothetical protein
MSVTFTPDSLLGEVLAHVLAAQGAPSEIILAAAAAVFNIGLQTLRDVHEPYVTQLHGGDSPQWSALRQALESAGVPPAAIETVLGALALELVHVGLCGSQQPSQCVATSEVACSSSTAAREVRSSAASAPDAKRESREHVLPPDMINLRTVLLRLERAIVAYDRCANLEKQRAPGYTIAKNWKQRHKKRGFASRKCVMHTRRIATAPYSDMGVKLGGVKVVINSMLFTLPPDPDAHGAATSLSKRGGGTPVHKHAAA